eukprot:6180126-Pleurochrysis_carterae.AAC.2
MTPCLSHSATSISSRCSFTHAEIPLGALYQDKAHVQRELKLMTLTVGQVKDNARPGLRLMLGDGISCGIDAEICELYSAGVIGVDIFIGGEEWVLRLGGCASVAARTPACAAVTEHPCCRPTQATALSRPSPMATPSRCGLGGFELFEQASAAIAPISSYESLLAAGHAPPDR